MTYVTFLIFRIGVGIDELKAEELNEDNLKDLHNIQQKIARILEKPEGN